MLIRLDSKSLNMDIIVGVLEKYETSDEIKAVYEKVQKLKNETNEFIKNNFGDLKISEIVEKLKTDTEQKDKWQKYMTETYNTELTVIIEEIKEINKKICPGFSESLVE